MSVVIGVCFAAAVFLLLQHRLLQVLLGIALLSHAVNLLILVGGGLGGTAVPIVPPGETVLDPAAADPLPQALILTAIVISFGLLGFALALAWRCVAVLGHDDTDRLRNTDRLDEVPAEAPR
ncbi:MAG: NADH-quinone oxidoreductase subunit K [Planctomycetota bacterium]